MPFTFLLVRKLNRFLCLPWREKVVVLQAMILLPVVGIALRTLGFQRLTTIFCRQRDGQDPTPGAADEARVIHRLVRMATRNNPTPENCLRRSLVLLFLLRRRGIPANLQIGVSKEAGEFQAHAWVELAGVAINDAPDVALRFAPLENPYRMISPS